MHSEPAIEKHQVDEVRNLQRELQALAPQVTARMTTSIRCNLAPDDLKSFPEGCKLVHFVRHGEGHHNVVQREWRGRPTWDGLSEPYTLDNDPSFKFLDPELTTRGREQAEALQARAALLSVDLLVCSTLRRATQTGLIAFANCMANRPLSVIASDLCHEIGGKHTCDKRSAVSQLRLEFPSVDYSLVKEEEDPLWLDGMTRESLASLSHRAARFAEWLGQRPEKQIAVASHSAFLLAIFNAVFTTDKEQTCSWFGTGEMRTVLLSFAPFQEST
ncbi:hypothetical protein AB1Y20_008019 [Prymnesium parvum]|uniref:Phosphoglycerate mutase-like protein n=1 Tax=Prymnesium parvum TaxID=97485 RepID=A0AB34IVY0_PRYPA|mmetsp:Transcript_32251/g.80327  ORF Transcript_32251/g.80327 Transcript_32251/m.80327 type:complete len:274 (+) Transcript_32251:105-926(+)